MRCAVFFVFVMMMIGCGEPSVTPTPVYPVNGKVMYDGKPAAGVRVFLSPTSNPNPEDAVMHPNGVTDASGNFSITTYQKDDGAPEGSYMVILHWPFETKEGEEQAEGERLFGWYDFKHTKLSTTVKAGANSLPTFNLPARSGPPPKVEGVPGRN